MLNFADHHFKFPPQSFPKSLREKPRSGLLPICTRRRSTQTRRMANYFSNLGQSKVRDLKSKLKHLEVFDVSCNSECLVGEGSSAIVFKDKLGNEIVAVKRFNQLLSEKKYGGGSVNIESQKCCGILLIFFETKCHFV